MSRKHVLALIGSVLAAAVIFSLSGCGAKSKGNTIVIGEFAPLTGSTAEFGKSTDDGVRLAVDEINARGGILGKQIELRVEDDRSNPAEARTAVTKLIHRDGVAAVIGEVASTRTLNAAPVCQASGVPMITPASTNEKVTKVGSYVFRVCYVDQFQGAVDATFAAKKGLKRAAILKDIHNDYSIGLADSFKQTFTKLGGTVAGEESYSEGDTDFSAQLTTIKGENPQVVFVPGYYGEVSLIAIKARQLGISVPLLGGDGWDSPTLVPNAGKSLEGSYFCNHYSADNPAPEVQKFVKAYQAKYSQKPNALAALGYDSMMIMADAIKRAGSTDGAKIRDAIAATKDFPGVTGKITIDRDRNAKKSAVILQVRGSDFRHVETVTP